MTQSEESQSEAVISRLHLSDNQKKLKEDFETKRRREAKDDALKEKQRRKRVCNWHFLIDCLLEIFILNFEQFKSTCRNSVQGSRPGFLKRNFVETWIELSKIFLLSKNI